MNESPRTLGDFRLFDPLGYANNPLLAALEAADATIISYGFGSSGPRGFYGTTMPHLHLEETLSKSFGTESAIVYSAGVATASSVIPALVNREDCVIVDTEVHLGIRAGLRLCRATVSWVPQGDLTALEAALIAKTASKGAKAKTGKRTFVILETLSQRTGRVAPLVEAVALKEKYGATLILDESLSFGTFGASGRGFCEHSRVDASRVDCLLGSLEHAVAGIGGFCVGKRRLVEHQRLAGKGYCFSAACPPSACSAAATIIEDILGAPGASRRSALHRNVQHIRDALEKAIVQSRAPVELVSSHESYVQHIRWTARAGESPPADLEERFFNVAEACAESSGFRIQLCSPSICAAEAAFDERTAAPTRGRGAPSLRACASAVGPSPEAMRAFGEVLGECLKQLTR